MNELKKMKDLFDDFIKEADKFIEKQKPLELEEENFKINSDGWKKITVDNEEYLENPEKDVWELLSEECRGEQLFTYDSAIRETKKAGKLIPSDEQLSELLKTAEDLKNVVYPGYRSANGSYYNQGDGITLWSASESSYTYAWLRSFIHSYATVARYSGSKAYGVSVRCLKN